MQRSCIVAIAMLSAMLRDRSATLFWLYVVEFEYSRIASTSASHSVFASSLLSSVSNSALLLLNWPALTESDNTLLVTTREARQLWRANKLNWNCGRHEVFEFLVRVPMSKSLYERRRKMAQAIPYILWFVLCLFYNTSVTSTTRGSWTGVNGGVDQRPVLAFYAVDATGPRNLGQARPGQLGLTITMQWQQPTKSQRNRPTRIGQSAEGGFDWQRENANSGSSDGDWVGYCRLEENRVEIEWFEGRHRGDDGYEQRQRGARRPSLPRNSVLRECETARGSTIPWSATAEPATTATADTAH